MTEPQTPTTEAGRALIAGRWSGIAPTTLTQIVLAIEAESATAERRRVLAEVREQVKRAESVGADASWFGFRLILDELAEADR